MGTNQNNKILYRGSIWRKWDLQIHTYLDANWRWPSGYPNGNDNQEERIAKFNSDFVQHCLDNKTAVVAITDHNTGEAIDGLQKRNRELGEKITILPGVEVISTEGIHILVIFNPDPVIKKNRWSTWKETIDNFLTAIFTDSPRFEDEGTRNTPTNSPSSIDEIVKKSKEFSAIVIFPHVLSSSIGIFSCNSRTRKRVLKLCNILDLACDIDEVEGKSTNVNKKLLGQQFDPQKFALIRTSDSKKIADVGSKFTWIKADPNFEGLKQIIYEPKARICIKEEAPLYLYPQIVSAMMLNTKNYQTKREKEIFPPITLEKKIFFSPNLTTIIGPRAAGKTALVELIGYVVNKFSIEKKDKKLPLIEFLSEEFTELEVEVIFQNGTEEITSLTRKMKEWKDPFYTSSLQVEYWTQGEIEKKADSPKQIADYIGCRLRSDLLIKTKEELESLLKEMETIRSDYADKLQIEIDKKKLEAEREQIESYFKKLKAKEYKELAEKIKSNRLKRQLLDGLIQEVKDQAALLKRSVGQLKLSTTVDKDKVLELFEGSASLKKKIENFYHLKESQLESIVKDLEAMAEEIGESDVKKELDKENAELMKQFTEYCKSNGITATRNEVEKRNNRIKFIDQQLSQLGNRLKKFESDKKRHGQLVNELKTKLKLWVRENQKLIYRFNESFKHTTIGAIWDDPSRDITLWIKEKFIQSNNELKDVIEKNFKTKSPVREDYVKDVVSEIIGKVTGEAAREKIISILKQNKTPKLQDSSGKTETLRWFFEDPNTQSIREDLMMRLDEYAETGENHIKYGNKILGKDSMSFGERCGTLVELILLSGDHPLIIDQPEDHLDAKFVAEKVVNLIRDQKIKRQVIICTHNANIVVLGDSELVTSLSVENDNEVDVIQGSLENIRMRKIIYDVLEGGETAFVKREEKYGFK